jgi:hypothetical protein
MRHSIADVPLAPSCSRTRPQFRACTATCGISTLICSRCQRRRSSHRTVHLRPPAFRSRGPRSKARDPSDEPKGLQRDITTTFRSDGPAGTQTNRTAVWARRRLQRVVGPRRIHSTHDAFQTRTQADQTPVRRRSGRCTYQHEQNGSAYVANRTLRGVVSSLQDVRH